MKKKKNKTRRRRQISAAPASGKAKDVEENTEETENVGEEELVENYSNALDDPVFSSANDDIIEDFTEEEMLVLIERGTEFNKCIWFILLPQEDEAGYPLLQKQYIHVNGVGTLIEGGELQQITEFGQESFIDLDSYNSVGAMGKNPV
ncbi:hypothetical protein U1Q18_029049 [Sarracenia purpurea var. burkii]